VVGEWPPKISEVRLAMWRVESYASKIAAQDDNKKCQRLVREYKKAADRLLAVALTERDDRRTPAQRATED
jgi:hypothetical protein